VQRERQSDAAYARRRRRLGGAGTRRCRLSEALSNIDTPLEQHRAKWFKVMEEGGLKAEKRGAQ
jgi:hypothetical protein